MEHQLTNRIRELRSGGAHRVLDMYTVYDNPTDYPGQIVVRRWSFGDVSKPHYLKHQQEGLRADPEPFMVTTDRGAIWRVMHAGGLTPIPRSPNDDPKIIETWL